jgi:hypothetical protein
MAAKHAGPEKRPDSGGASRRASWRGRSADDGPAPAEYNWQRTPGDKRSAEVSRKNFRRRVTLATLTSVLLVLGGVFVWYLIYNAPAAPLLAVAVTDYSAPLPPNAFAQEDVDRFPAAATSTGFLSAGRGNLRTTALDPAQWDSSDAALKQIGDWLQHARPGGPQKNVVLLYLSAHGVVDEDGHPCLILAGESQPFDRERWLRLDRVIEILEKTRPTTNKVLILDANRMEANWNIGLLYNGFAEAVTKSLEGVNSVAVLSSAGPGEVAYAAPELQGTPFGYYVFRALTGEPAANADGDAEISLKELYHYVRSKVGEWVGRNRSDRQTPMLLLPQEQDFRLVFAVPQAGAPSAAPDSQAAYFEAIRSPWEKIGDLWQRHERLRTAKGNQPIWYDRCHEWHQFQQGLVRCEQLALAGIAYDAEAKSQLEQMEQLADELERRQDVAMPMHNLTTARRWHGWPANQDKLRLAVARHLDGSTDPPQPLPTEVTGDYFVRADGAWQWLLHRGADQGPAGISREKVREMVAFVGRPKEQPELVEMHLLRLLLPDRSLPGTGAADEVWREPIGRLFLVPALRELAELTSSLEEPRAQYAVRTELADADRLLREAEDSLFVGGDGMAKLGELVEQAEGAYRQTGDKAQRLSTAFATRDRAWSLLPYLAQWYWRRPEPRANQDVAELEAALRVIEQAGDLDAKLARYLAEQSPTKERELAGEQPIDLQDVVTAAGRVETGLERLWTNFDQFADEVRRQQTWDERSPRDIAMLLSNPLVSGDGRHELRERYFSEMSRLAATWEVAADTTRQGSDEPSVGDLNPHLLRLLATEHPALVLAGSTEPSDVLSTRKGANDKPNADWMRLAKQGGTLRDLIIKSLAPAATSAAHARQDDVANRRSALSDRERQWRRLAALCTVPSLRDKDPIRRLAQFDGNELLLWQTRRRLDDFWGNGDGDSATPPYFALAFDDTRSAARKLDADPADGERWRDLAVLCNELTETAKSAIFADAGSEQPRLSQGSFVKAIRLNLPEHLPTGTAALAAADGLGRAAQLGDQAAGGEALASRWPVVVRNQGERVFDQKLLVRQNGEQDPPANVADNARWTLAWLFRGHLQRSPFVVAPEGPSIKLVYQRHPPQPTYVTVQGDESREASVVFILDCSYSMHEDTGDGTRMDVARTALKRIIERLAVTGKYRVGLWLYGHRASITTSGARRWNGAWGVDNGVARGKDVAQIVPLGLLDAAMKAEILGLLNNDRKVQPWGATPLYLSIVEAMRTYRPGPAGGPRRLVVITDDLDQVPADTPNKTQADDVIKAVRADQKESRDSPLRIQVLHCGSEGDQTLRALVEDKDKLKGDYISVGNFGLLQKKLQEAVGLAEYEVARVDSNSESTLRRQSLGEPYLVQSVVPGRKNRYEVRLAQRSPPVRNLVELEGEESLLLSLVRDAGEDSLIHQRYDRGGQSLPPAAVRKNVFNPSPGNSDPDFNPKEFYVAAHRPEHGEGGSWAFPISIQNGDGARFSPRPTEAWVEITPVLAKGSKLPPYPVYDLSYEPERPVPVLRCEVPKWPDGSQEAEIRLWFRLRNDSDVKSREVPIADVDADASASSDLHVPGAPDARFKVRTDDLTSGQVPGWPSWPGGARLIVEEEHPPLTPTVEWLRVQTLDPPDRVERTFNFDGRWARHEFFFAEKGRLDVRRDKLVLTSRGSVQKGAVAVDEPMHAILRD